MHWPHLCFLNGRLLFYNVTRLCSVQQHWIFSRSTSAAYFFSLYLFKQRGAQFHCLFPNGYFSVVLEQQGINDTCQSLKYTFIKQTSAAPHEPGEHSAAQSDTFIDRTCCQDLSHQLSNFTGRSLMPASPGNSSFMSDGQSSDKQELMVGVY